VYFFYEKMFNLPAGNELIDYYALLLFVYVVVYAIFKKNMASSKEI